MTVALAVAGGMAFAEGPKTGEEVIAAGRPPVAVVKLPKEGCFIGSGVYGAEGKLFNTGLCFTYWRPSKPQPEETPRLCAEERTGNTLQFWFNLANSKLVESATKEGLYSTAIYGTAKAKEVKKLREQGAKFELFTCGPDGLLKAVSDRAMSLGVPGWISMDRHMICGVGACYACIQKTVRGNSRCCIEGPVFAAEDLVW